MADEVMAERRRLFLEEMVRIRECEQQSSQADAAALPSPTAVRATAAASAARAPRPRAALLALMTLCVALTLPVFGYIRWETQAIVRVRRQESAWHEDGIGSVQRARVFFGSSDIIAVRSGQYGPFLLLRPGLSDAKIIAQARRVRDMLSAHAYPTRGPQPWRVGVCRADIPCGVTVVRVSGPKLGGMWCVAVGSQIIP